MLDTALQSTETFCVASPQPGALADRLRATARHLCCESVEETFVLSLVDGLLPRLPRDLVALDFEARKDATRLFEDVIRCVERLDLHNVIVASDATGAALTSAVLALLEIFRQPDLVVHASAMLQALAGHPELVVSMLEENVVLVLLTLARNESFEVSAEAFACLRALLLNHPVVSQRWLSSRFDAALAALHRLLVSGGYAAQRQGLNLLAHLLLHPTFASEMVRYVSNPSFLKLHMDLLRDGANSIRVAAFHVVKVFVANPKPSPKVHRILVRNSGRLADFLERSIEASADETLAADLQATIEKLNHLRKEELGSAM